VHQSDRGSQQLSLRYRARPAAAGIEAWVGSRGDAYDNARAEPVIGRFKTEVIRHGGPWRRLDDVEYAALEWVAWFNTRRLLEPLGCLPPAEYEMQFERLAAAPRLLEHSTAESPDNPGRFSRGRPTSAPRHKTISCTKRSARRRGSCHVRVQEIGASSHPIRNQ
jgi:hypothetical protein